VELVTELVTRISDQTGRLPVLTLAIVGYVPSGHYFSRIFSSGPSFVRSCKGEGLSRFFYFHVGRDALPHLPREPSLG
jgi:hypothetical protein